MKAFQQERVPVALAGQVLRLEPRDELRAVRSLEQLPLIGPVDFGAITAGQNATDSSGDVEIEVTELENRQQQLTQIWVHVMSPVEVEVRQDGQQDTRFQTANETAVITQDMSPQFSELFVLEDDVPYFVVSNPNTYDLQKSLVAFSGFKYLLEPDVDPSQVEGQPISIPIEKLERSTQAAGARGVQQRDEQAGMAADRAARRR